RYRSEAGKAPLRRVELQVGGAGTEEDLRAATLVAQAVLAARDLINTPPNDLFPESFAERAAELAKDAGLETEILDEHALRTGGYGGILGVGAGSSRQP